MNIKYAQIGERISAKRKLLKMTQAELAEKANLTPKYISRMESPKNRSLSIASVLQLCGALDVSPSFLLLGVNDEADSAEYTAVAQKLKLCDKKQLQQISRIIDAIIIE
jgi:transcriptional regulator with XRE-family HTH domain